MVKADQKQEVKHNLVRWIWLLAFVLAVILTLTSLPGYWQQIQQLQRFGDFAALQGIAIWLSTLLSLSTAVLCLTLALLVLIRKPGEPMALVLSFFLLSYGVFFGGPLELSLDYWFPQQSELALMLQGILFLPVSCLLILIFPNGRFIPGWTRWIVFFSILLTVLFILTFTPDEWVRINSSRSRAGFVVLSALALFSLGNQLYRYRRVYSLVERQQTKWVLIGIVATFVLGGLSSIPYLIYLNLPSEMPEPWWIPLGSAVWRFVVMILPVSLTIAILRYRLFDIDVIIRRTLVYGALSLTLAVIYFGSIVLLQSLFTAVIGHQSAVAVVATTLLIAALFTPLRRRIQNDIDRRFYRKKYDAEKTVAAFSAGLRQEVDLEQIGERLLFVVEETMQPEQVSLWMKKVKK